jgi:hypothetical protein
MRQIYSAISLSLVALASAAAKHATSGKVAFIEVGRSYNVVDNFEPKRTNRINAKQLNTAIHRVLMLDARADLNVKLPSGDLFNRQDANVVIFVDGVDINPSWLHVMPFVREIFDAQDVTSYMIGSTIENRGSSVLFDSLSTFDIENLSEISCGCRDDAIFNAVACSKSERLHVSEPSIDNAESHADLAIVQELSLLSETLNKLRSVQRQAKPALFVLYLSSLVEMSSQYGVTHSKTLAAASTLDKALRSILQPDDFVTESKKQPNITAQLVVGPTLKEFVSPPVKRSRRLQSTSSSASPSSTDDSTLIDIKQFQLNLWTGVFLTLLAFMAIYGVANMDVGRDSLLYAKFQADTSGKND